MTLPEWLTETDAPWWAVIGTPLVVALLTYLLTRRSSRQDQDRARDSAERSELRDRKIVAYADFVDALNRQHLAQLNGDMESMREANAKMLRELAVIRLLAPPYVYVTAAVASEAMMDRPTEHEHWHRSTAHFIDLARRDLETS
jgi:hypothetical protein